MIVIGVVNHKGGTAKTTVAKLLTEYFASKKKRVIGIDLDAQCNYSARLIEMDIDQYKGLKPPIHPDYDPEKDKEWDGRDSSADLFLYGEVAPYPTYLPNVELIPSHGKDLEDLLLKLDRKNLSSKIVPIIKQWLEIPAVQQDYDICIIDTPPSKSILIDAVFRAATHIIIPTIMEEMSIEGLFSMIGYYKMENYGRDENEQIKIAGILPTLFDGRVKEHKELLRMLGENNAIGSNLIELPMHRRAAYNRTNNQSAEPKSILGLPKKSKPYIEVNSICKEIERRIYG